MQTQVALLREKIKDGYDGHRHQQITGAANDTKVGNAIR